MTDNIITLGHIARHTPLGAGAQGRNAAIMDVAQDFLLRDLHTKGVLDTLAFKGGTALRKLYAGNAGRFSLDLDFASVEIGANPEDALARLIEAVDGLRVAPFSFGVGERRGKWTLTYTHPFGDSGASLQSKVDLSPPPWLPPIFRAWQPMRIHQHYGSPPLPKLQVIRLEENLAEKIARLNRSTIARDMYDLSWAISNPITTGRLNLGLIRRLALLKVWVDANGVHAGSTFWRPGHTGCPFDPESWLRDRSEEDFDIEDIGALTTPTPTAKDLSSTISEGFGFLRDLDADERVLAQIRERDRPLALRILNTLLKDRLQGILLY
jgi:predicted nucleotidyltransferase component of viral defense system